MINKLYYPLICFFALMVCVLLLAHPSHAAIAPETYSPSSGLAMINKNYTYNTFKWDNVQAFRDDPLSTYEQETILYNGGYAMEGYYWISNLPYAYKDTTVSDKIDNFAVGSAKANEIKKNRYYYTYYMLLNQYPWVKSSQGQINAQKGHRIASWCTFSTWCVLTPDATNRLAKFTAPATVRW